MRGKIAAVAACFGLLLLSPAALAAPYAGTGHAAIGGKVDLLKARDQALERARKAALEAALDQLGGDPSARKQVLASSSVWTRSYRVLRQDDDGATATAVVSVEIDTAKLSKAIAASQPPATTTPLVLLPQLALTSDACPTDIDAQLRRVLAAAGIVRDVAPGSAGPTLAARLRCDSLGFLAYPRRAVFRATLQLQGRDEVVSTGFGDDPATATRDALTGLATQLRPTAASTGVTIKIAAPWPAARVRRLERSLAESVLGVSAVRVAGVGSDGTVSLRVEGGLSANELHARLANVQVPGATLVVGELESNVVHVRFQVPPSP